jgi:hypothetical protein
MKIPENQKPLPEKDTQKPPQPSLWKPPKELEEEYHRYRVPLSDWLNGLYVDRYELTLVNTERAGWHLWIGVDDDTFELVMSKIHEMPKTTLEMRIEPGSPFTYGSWD